MIFDRLETSAAYAPLSDRFASAFAYLRGTDLANIADGTYEVVGKDVLAIVQTYFAKPRAEGRWEAHREYADIQFVVTGAERMGVTPLGSVTSQTPYDAGNDLEFFEGAAGVGQFFRVDAGAFAVFFPHDVHMPSLALDDARRETVKKVVMKVRLR